MLDTTIENLRLEIMDAERERDAVMDSVAELIDGYVGSLYQEGRQPEIETHENHAFDFVINTLPALTFHNPRVTVRSRRPRVHREIASALQHGLNRWAIDVDLAETLTEIAMDTLFVFGLGLITLEPLPGYENKEIPPLRPRFTRVDPYRAIIDPQAKSVREVRFIGHESYRDRDDLLAARRIDPKTGKSVRVFNHHLIKDLAAAEQKSGRSDRRYASKRDMIRIYEIYVPEQKMIYTLAADADSNKYGNQWLRDPRPAFGPPSGPYIVFGLYGVPNEPYPLSPLKVTAVLAEELNAHVDQLAEQADSMRQVTLIEAGTNDTAVIEINNARNGDTIGITGFTRDMVETITIGGPSPEQMDYVMRLRDRLDRKSGIPEFARGNITGATATENTYAQSAMDQRRRWMQAQFRKRVKQVLWTAGWMMAESENIVFHVPIAEEEEPTGRFVSFSGRKQERDGVFVGGRQPGQDDFNYFELEIDVDAYSTEFRDASTVQKEVDDISVWISQMAQLMPATPWVNWPELTDAFFESRHVSDGRRFVNWEYVRAVMGGMQFSGSPPAQVPDLATALGKTQQGQPATTPGAARPSLPFQPPGAGRTEGGQSPGYGAQERNGTTSPGR